MFTGIIESVGQIKAIEGNVFTIAHTFTEPFEIGESVAVNGVCLTVIEREDKALKVEIIEASRSVTTFGNSKPGDKVNLERAAKIGQRNSGHHVTGHVDQVGFILKLEKQSDYWLIRVGINPENRTLVVHKGSVSLEGISLTVSGVGPDWFEVSIIAHTWEETNLHTKKEGDMINVEFDILGKYKALSPAAISGALGDFDDWNKLKKRINQRKNIYVQNREIWYLHIGKNIGVEMDGENAFLCPVLVFKSLGKYSFLGIPFSRTKREGSYYFPHEVDGKQSYLCLNQMSVFDTKRARKRIQKMRVSEFILVQKKVRQAYLP